jgi:NADH:ubiquinone oxidoreductase subunit F (NADH-binding)
MGCGFNFDIELVEGAGAFVCGEETALISSLEGQPGRSRPRPPYPAQKGLWGHPTNINNVETWFNIPPIIAKGPAWFTEIGSEASPGTKAFSLVGKVVNTGLVEMPLGTPLSKFVYDAGGGTTPGHNVKAVQTGGPSGGCIPHRQARCSGRLRFPDPARLDHGFGRHGGDGRRQLHGRRRPLFHRVHPF